MKVTEELVEFVKRWEGLKLVASPDPLVPGVWDYGHGHVLRCNTASPPTITAEGADKLLREDLAIVAAAVDSLVTVTLAQHEFDALCSFALNVGTDIDEDRIAEGLGDSTLLRKLNNSDFWGAADEFLAWNRASGKVTTGLVKRRQAEQSMFEEAIYTGAP